MARPSRRTKRKEYREHYNAEIGERYTVKRYESEKVADGDTWRHVRVTLQPLNPACRPILLNEEDEGLVRVVAEVIEVLG